MGRSMEPVEGAWNFRDVAEYGAIQPGKLFRSSELCNLTIRGRAALTALGVNDIADLRSSSEVERHGANAVDGEVTVHALALEGNEVAPHEHALQRLLAEPSGDADPAEQERALMMEEYGRLARLPRLATALRHTMQLIAANRRVLVCCFAGKDRTGVIVALLLEALGVDRTSVYDDYLASSAAAAALRQAIIRGIGQRYDVPADMLRQIENRLPDQVLGVRKEYLDAGRAAIEDHYGSLHGLLSGAGINADLIRRNQHALLS